jgi:hypothetical protein
MDIEFITIENLLARPDIAHVEHDGHWYFHHGQLNAACDDIFKFSPTVMMKIPMGADPRIFKKVAYISAPEIVEHVEHLKTMPSFASRIDQFFFGKPKDNK